MSHDRAHGVFMTCTYYPTCTDFHLTNEAAPFEIYKCRGVTLHSFQNDTSLGSWL